MALLRTIESKIEGLFEGVFGRAFRTHVSRSSSRASSSRRWTTTGPSPCRAYVPNEYSVYLSAQDRRQFAGYEDSLVQELQEYLAEHARRERYSLLTPPRVLVTTDDDLAVGEFGIGTRLVADEASSADAPPPPDLPLEQPEHTMVYKARPRRTGQEEPEAGADPGDGHVRPQDPDDHGAPRRARALPRLRRADRRRQRLPGGMRRSGTRAKAGGSSTSAPRTGRR